MLVLVWRQLRGRTGRSVALLVGMLLATTGFIVLTGTTTASRLQVTGTVERNTWAAYDILVRPQGTRTPLETERGLVRPNYLSGLFGGITTAQYNQVKTTAGVEIAAPIAMLGYSTTGVPIPLDLTDTVDRSLDRQVIRIEPTFIAERGLSTATAAPRYVYVTTHPLIYPLSFEGEGEDESVRYSDGGSYPSEPDGWGPREVLPDGTTAPVHGPQFGPLRNPGGSSEREPWSLDAVRLRPDGRFEGQAVTVGAGDAPSAITDRLVLSVALSVPFLLAAVDPDAEERLVGISRTVVDGRPLHVDDTVIESRRSTASSLSIPVLMTSRPFLDGAVRATYTRLTPERIAGVPEHELERELGTATGVPAGTSRHDLVSGYRSELGQDANKPDEPLLRAGIHLGGSECCSGQLQTVVQPGHTEYDELADGTLRAGAVRPDLRAYDDERTFNPLPRPWLAEDVSFRPLGALALASGASAPYRDWRAVGIFDPEKLTGFSDLSRVPLETYEPPTAIGADQPSRDALGGQPLLPGGNPAGYLSAPPFLLTSLAAVPELFKGSASPQRAAPISAIRVQISDVDGFSERSAERVRLIAERIADTTGLDVDITLGSSPAPQTVELAAGSFGRPALRLTENWSAMGVAAVIIKAVDRKSVVLFLLVLVVCALFLGNAVSAAVRARTPELAVLACLGWPARRIGALILGEVATLGLAAGLLSLALAPLLSAALGIGLGGHRAALAVPVALLLALAAGTAPALRASRAHPAAALHPAVTQVRSIRRPRTLLGLALVNLARTPGRTLLGAGALGIGVAALTLVAAAAYAFRGAIVGSLLGDTVSLSVRNADTVAAVATVLLGAAAVADVLYLNIRDRAAELATLQSIGWTDNALVRLVTYEGVALGALGSLGGAAIGLTGAAWLVGGLPAGLVLAAAGTALAGMVSAGVAALVPAALLRRLPTAQLLAAE